MIAEMWEEFKSRFRSDKICLFGQMIRRRKHQCLAYARLSFRDRCSRTLHGRKLPRTTCQLVRQLIPCLLIFLAPAVTLSFNFSIKLPIKVMPKIEYFNHARNDSGLSLGCQLNIFLIPGLSVIGFDQKYFAGKLAKYPLKWGNITSKLLKSIMLIIRLT